MRLNITGTATFYAADDGAERPTRQELIEVLDGAEMHITIEGKSFRIELEHDPFGASEEG